MFTKKYKTAEDPPEEPLELKSRVNRNGRSITLLTRFLG